MKNYTYCYYITEDEKVSELLVSYVSLMATNPQYPVSCIVGKLMSKEAIDFIKEIGINVLDGTDWNRSEQILDPDGEVKSEFEYSGKLSLYQFTQFDKIVYMDSDTYILKNMDDTFNFKDGSMVKLFFDKATNMMANAGLLVCVPNMKVVNRVKQAIVDGYSRGYFEYPDDQFFLMKTNDFWNRSDIKIPPEYNVFPFFIDKYRENPMFDEKSVKMLHWMGGVKIDGVFYKPYNTPSITMFPNLDIDYMQEYLKQYNLIISIYQAKYGNLPFLNQCVINPFV